MSKADKKNPALAVTITPQARSRPMTLGVVSDKASRSVKSVEESLDQSLDQSFEQGADRDIPLMQGGKPVSWDQRLGFLMHDVSRLRRIVFDGYMKPAGVTRSQWWVLAYLSRNDGIIQTELATVLDIGKAALGGLIDRLESSGFVERRPDTDRRAKRVYLSASGKDLIRQMTAKSDAMSEEILADVSAEERARLADYLIRIKGRLLAMKVE